MNLIELYKSVREKFPLISEKADALHERLWGHPEEEAAYVWFESLANALNLEMAAEVDPNEYVSLLKFLDGALGAGTDELCNCLDVGFMENLFFQISSIKAKPYWEITPRRLRDFHVAFHDRSPLL